MYIVFFALSPPAFVKTVLSHPIGVASAFGLAIYTALYYSRAVGGLLIIALLASMTQTTEHLTQQETSQIQSQISDTQAQIATAQASTAADKQQRIEALNVQLQNLQSRLNDSTSSAPPPAPPAGTGTLPPVPPNTTVPSGQTAAATSPVPQPSTPPALTPPTTPPVLSSTPPRAVAACNIENFAPF